MKILKFGGSSVGTPESILRVKEIVSSRQEPSIVVVSALGGVTDQLIRASIYHTVCPSCGYYRGKLAVEKAEA